MPHVKYLDGLYRASKSKALTITLHFGVHMSTFSSLTHTHTRALSLALVCASFFCNSHVREEGERPREGERGGRKKGPKKVLFYKKKEKQEKQIKNRREREEEEEDR